MPKEKRRAWTLVEEDTVLGILRSHRNIRECIRNASLVTSRSERGVATHLGKMILGDRYHDIFHWPSACEVSRGSKVRRMWTPSETDSVVEMLGRGCDIAEIASALGRSSRSVWAHIGSEDAKNVCAMVLAGDMSNVDPKFHFMAPEDIAHCVRRIYAYK